MLLLNLQAFDALPASSLSRRLFIDAEATADGWALIIRGEDMAVVGRSLLRRSPALVFNGLDGAYETFIVAQGNQDEVEQAADALRALYQSDSPIGKRLAMVPMGLAPLALLLVSRFAPEKFARDGRVWRCQQFSTTRAAARVAPTAA